MKTITCDRCGHEVPFPVQVLVRKEPVICPKIGREPAFYTGDYRDSDFDYCARCWEVMAKALRNRIDKA